MKRNTIFAFLALSFCVKVWAQNSISRIDFVKVKDGLWKEAIYYYEHNWKVYRDIALEKGYIKSYKILKVLPDSVQRFDIMLITEYKDKEQELKSEERFAEIIRKATPNGPALLNDIKPNLFRENLFLTEGEGLFSNETPASKTDSPISLTQRSNGGQSVSQDWNKGLTLVQKLYTLSAIWRNVSENFAFFENVPWLNWDSLYQAYIPKVLNTSTKYSFYRLLERFICSLRDGHTLMYHFNELFPHYVRFNFNNNLRLYPEAINKRVYITRVGSEEMTKAIPIGTEILEVNNMPVVDYLVTHVFPYIAASTEQQLWFYGVPEMFRGVVDTDTKNEWNVKFKKPDGDVFEMMLTLTKEPVEFEGKSFPLFRRRKELESRWLDGGVFYLALNTFAKDTVIDMFRSIVPDIRKAKSVIIDLRYNEGGNSNTGAEILSYFTDVDTLVGSKWQTRISNAYYKSNGYNLRNAKTLDEEEKEYVRHYRNQSWMDGGTMKFENKSPRMGRLRMPLVVLTSHFTVSAGEDFLIMLEGIKGRAIRIGQITSGSSGQRLGFRIPTGGTYFICTKKDTYEDGRKFVGVGILPDIEVQPSIQDLIEGKDMILSKALEYLNKRR